MNRRYTYSKVLPPDLQPKPIKNYGLTSEGVVPIKSLSRSDEILERVLENSDILVAEKLIERGMIGRSIIVGTTPTLIIQSRFLKMYRILNPSLSVDLTSSGTLFASASRAAGGPTASSSIGVANHNDIHLFLDITAIAAGAVVINAQVLDLVSGNYAISQSDIFGSPITVSTNYVYLGALGVGTDFRATYTTTGVTTFSLGYTLKGGLVRRGTGTGLSKTIYLGNSEVTIQAGIPLLEGESINLFLNENVELWGIAETPLDLRVFEMQ